MFDVILFGREARTRKTRPTVHGENLKTVAQIRQAITANFTLDRQMDYTDEEASVVQTFEDYCSAGYHLEAEDFMREQLDLRPNSVLLNYRFAKYLKEKKHDVDAAVERLEDVRQHSGNHPSVLTLLVECHLDRHIPNYTGASTYIRELERLDDDDVRLQVGGFYVGWSTQIKQRSELDPLREHRRRQRYKNLANRAIKPLLSIEDKSHKMFHLLAQAYFNMWDYERALSAIAEALSMVGDDSNAELAYRNFKRIILEKREKYGSN